MRRLLPTILLLTSILGLGTGALQYLHEREHLAEDAKQSAPEHHHDESTCQICAQLHAPMTSHTALPVLVCLGLFVAFLTLLTPPLVPQRQYFRIDCRGPPAC